MIFFRILCARYDPERIGRCSGVAGVRRLFGPQFLIVFLLLSGNFAEAQRFQNPVRVPVNGDPGSVLTPDLNNDGRPDLVVGVGNAAASVLYTYLANASGGYTAASQINLPLGDGLVCKDADVNGDGKIDLVCPPAPALIPYNLYVYLGNGDGTFQPGIGTNLKGYNTTGYLIVGAADMNRDGHLDFIVGAASSTGQGYENFMLLGDGTGHFSVSAFFGDISTGTASIRDVNGDGNLDIVARTGPVVLFGKGDGTFSSEFYSSANAYCLYADFERNGAISAACDGLLSKTLQFFHQNTDGSFNLTTPYASATLNTQVQGLIPFQAIDLNGDGLLDVLLSSNDGLLVALGKPGLTFADPVPYAAGSTTYSSFGSGAFQDMNGDGFPDFVSTAPNSVYISYGSASGVLGAPILHQSGTALFTSVVADFTGDGIPDVLTSGLPSMNLLAGKGDGSFGPPIAIPFPAGYSTAVGSSLPPPLLTGDFDGDGKQDFIVPLDQTAGILGASFLYLGTGNGSFATPIPIDRQTLMNFTSGVVVADANHDGKDDLVEIQNNTIEVFLSRGDGTFAPAASTSFANSSYGAAGILLHDIDGDGIPDAILSLYAQTTILHGRGDGTFTTQITTLTIPPPADASLLNDSVVLVTTGDFDHDGKLDIAQLALSAKYVNSQVEYVGQLWVYYGNGSGVFSQPVSAGTFPYRAYLYMKAGDLNGDGLTDFVLAGETSFDNSASPLSVILSQPGRTFSSEIFLEGGDYIDSINVADFNRDGLGDMMVSNGYSYISGFSSNSFAVLLNQTSAGTATTIALACAPNPAFPEQQIAFAVAVAVANGSTTATLSGTVALTDAGSLLATLPLVNGAASYSAYLPLGVHPITATYLPAAGFAASTATCTENVIGHPTTTALVSSLNPALSGQTVTFTASVASPSGSATGSVLFADGATPLATVPLASSGLTVYSTSGLTVGAHAITATYVPTGTFAASTAGLTQTVLAGYPTSTTLACVPASAYADQAIVCTVSVSSAYGVPTGSIAIADGGGAVATLTLVNGAATYTTQLADGTHTLSATLVPGAGYSASSATAVETISARPTSTILAVEPNPSTYGQTIILSAAVTPTGSATIATGSITFYDGTAALSTVALDSAGHAAMTTSALSPRTHSLTAVYSGNAFFAPSTSQAVAEVVTPPALSATIASAPNPSIFYQPVQLTASVSVKTNGGLPALTGTVTFSTAPQPGGLAKLLGTAPLGANGTASLIANNLGVGAIPIIATYNGSASYSDISVAATAVSPALTQVVNPAPTALTLTATPNPADQGSVLTLTAIITDAPSTFPLDGSILFTEPATGATLGTARLAANGAATLSIGTLSVGTHLVVARYAGLSDVAGQPLFLPSTSPPLTVTIAPSTFTVAFTPPTLTAETAHRTPAPFAITSLGSFADTLHLTCSNLPVSASCSFANASPTLSAHEVLLGSVMLDTSGGRNCGNYDQVGAATPSGTRGTHPLLAALLPFGLFALIGCGRGRKMARGRLLGILLLLFAATNALTGCGTEIWFPTPPGTYSVLLTAQGTTTGKIQTATLTFNVTPATDRTSCRF